MENERRQEIPPTVLAMERIKKLFASTGSERQNFAKIVLDDGTTISIHFASITVEREPRNGCDVGVIGPDGTERAHIIMTGDGLVQIATQGTYAVQIGESRITASLPMRVLTYNMLAPSEQEAFRKSSADLVAWVGAMMGEGRYSPPPITIQPL